MPIYAYRCDACGLRKDVLQKMSDPALTVCPSCGAESFAKQLSAPAFQLKGTGWYVTDFRDNGKKADSADADKASPAAESGEGKVNGKDNAAANDTGDKKSGVKSEGKAEGSPQSKSDGASAKGTGTAPPAAPAAKPAAKPAGKGNGTSGSTGTTGGGSSGG